MFEVILICGIAALISALVLYLTMRSLSAADSSLVPKEKVVKDLSKKKAPVSKKSKQRNDNHQNRTKSNKSEKSIPNGVADNKMVEKKVSKTESSKVETPKPVEQSLNSEWMEVGKGSKKAIKTVKFSNEEETKPKETQKVKTTARETSSPIPSENAKNKSTKGKKQTEMIKEIKEVAAKHLEKASVVNKPEPVKEVVIKEEVLKVDQTKMAKTPDPSLSEDSKLRQRIGELMTENDKLKQKSKEDIKNFTVTMTQLSKESEQLRVKLKAEMTLSEDLKKRLLAADDLKSQNNIFQSELSKNVSNCAKLTREKAILENEKDKLEAANVLLNKKLNEKDKHHDEMINQIKIEANRNYQEMQGEKQKNMEKLLSVQNESIERNNKMKEIQQELLNSEARYSEVFKKQTSLQNEVEELKAKLAESNKQTDSINKKAIDDLTEQLNESRKIVTELKENNTKLCEENEKLLEYKENADEKIKLLQSEIEMLNKEQTIIKEEASNSSNDIQKQVNQLQKDLQEAKREKDELAKSVSEDNTSEILKEKVAQLENEVDKYKAGLEKTELVLSELQTSVNDEENRWKDALMKSETEAEKSKAELERVYKDIVRIQSRTEKTDVNFAYHCVDKSLSSLIDEMESRMDKFQENFDKVMQERDDALYELSEKKDHHTNIPQLNGSSDINNHRDSPEKTVDNNKLLEEKNMLENQCKKYKTLVDVGKDALEAEAAKVKKLQEELNELQSGQENTNASS